jgi:hypothetical protein
LRVIAGWRSLTLLAPVMSTVVVMVDGTVCGKLGELMVWGRMLQDNVVASSKMAFFFVATPGRMMFMRCQENGQADT